MKRQIRRLKETPYKRSIVLIGMMGAGKTSVGRSLQGRTGLALFDIDEMIAAQSGSSISEIFFQHGQDRFREMESEALQNLPAVPPAIVVTGGGAVLRQNNVDRLKQLGAVVWLDADEKTLFERASQRRDRPLLETENPKAAFSQMLQARRPLYAKIADIHVDTSRLTPERVTDAILGKMEEFTASQR